MLLATRVPHGVAASAGSISVRDFGAVGDGKTIETAAIQKAVDAAANSGGGEVRVPAGRYITGSLVLKSHTTLRLDAAGNQETSGGQEKPMTFRKASQLLPPTPPTAQTRSA